LFQEECIEDDGIKVAVDVAVESALDVAVGDDEDARDVVKSLIFLD